MSEICVFDLSLNRFKFEKQEEISRKVLKTLTKKNIGIHFNYLEYSPCLIKKYKMDFYFFLSDSPLYVNSNFCDFTDKCFFEETNIESNIRNKLLYVFDCINTLAKCGCKLIDIYISDGTDLEDEYDFIDVDVKMKKFEQEIVSFFKNHLISYQTGFIPVHFNVK